MAPLITRWCRRRAARRALEAAYRRALARAVAYALEGSRRHKEALRDIDEGRVTPTREKVSELQAVNRETERLIAVYRRIHERLHQ